MENYIVNNDSCRKAFPKKRILTIIWISLCLIIFAIFLEFNSVFPENDLLASESKSWLLEIHDSITTQIDKYALPGGIVGVSIKDLTTGEYFSINGDVQFNPASVIKVPVMVEAFHQMALGRISMDEKLFLHQQNKIQGSGSIQYLPNGSVFTVKRLINLMITDSDNTATNMLICRLGTKNINQYMRKVGLRHTVLKDPTMFCKLPGKYNLTSPNDMLMLLEKMYKGELVSADASKQMLDIMKAQLHKWGIQRFLPASAIVANKTGSLDFVRNDIGIILDKKHPYILSIFSKQLPSNYYGSVLVGSISKVIFDRRMQLNGKMPSRNGKNYYTRYGG